MTPVLPSEAGRAASIRQSGGRLVIVPAALKAPSTVTRVSHVHRKMTDMQGSIAPKALQTGEDTLSYAGLHAGAVHAAGTASLPSLRASKAVLVVAQEPFVRELLAAQLRAAGCFPMAVASPEEGRRLSGQLVPDLIVVDLDAGAAADFGWVFQLSRAPVGEGGKGVKTVVLSADAAIHADAEGVAHGADLFVAKPFEPRELMRQMLRLMRPPRAEPQQPRARGPLKAPAIELEREQPTVRLLLKDGWCSLDLPWTEHRLLAFLLLEPGRARSRDAIRDAVWVDTPVDLRTVDQYVRRLRKTLDAAGAKDLVKTVNGVGYRLEPGALNAGAGPTLTG
jgi:DNA-binding response OmpR family regulator